MEIPGIAVIAVIVVIAAIGIGAFMVMRDSSDREDRGPYSSGMETTGSFAALGATPDDGSDGGESHGGGSDGAGDGGGDGEGGD